ncbi:ribosomal protein L1 [Neolentinus lepideus HHB14362 ss-1]|uniref:Ribosomal protein n=1 Tax=Neolentinus lepideus HHB14362 ss-1 TaxID=1314782 RepID=A0A165U389_9AGAM|nr:ribosomal protein L1 [Neolentinus lepideus HHB14362 ss-1]
MFALGLLCRQCYGSLTLRPTAVLTRQLSTTPVLQLRQVKKKVPTISKKAAAAKARRKAMKKRRNIYEYEKMPLAEAINVLRAVEVARSNATYELIVKTEMKQGTPIPKGRINLPREAKEKTRDRVLVFAEGRQADDARKAGADIVGGPELIDGIISGRHQATTFLCTPALIRAITPRLGRVLGPRGLMPSERRGTVTDDIVGYIRRIQGSDEWKGDKAGTIRAPIGKLQWPVDDVTKNVRHFLTAVKRAIGIQTDETEKTRNNKPSSSITKVVLSSNQGPGIQIADI